MILVKHSLLSAFALEVQALVPSFNAKIIFESPKIAAHGDWASTIAMQLAKSMGQNPRQVAMALQTQLQGNLVFQQWVDAIEIAGPGFLNFRLKNSTKQQVIVEILQQGDAFGVQKPLEKTAETELKMMVEFVSANPTGPLHVGHGRQAALGDAICNLYTTQGWQVHREFYYNDAGVQIATLANSTQCRGKGLQPGDADWPESAYNGSYIADIAQDFLDKKTVSSDGRNTTASGDINDTQAVREFAVAYLRREQDLDLAAFGIKFDQYYLESSLYSDGKVDAAVQLLQTAGKTYEQDGALWLRSTDYGDDKDRVMRKSVSKTEADDVILTNRKPEYTYFVPDVAYHITKWQRGFSKAVNIQGTDHHGTIARVRAGLQAVNLGIAQGFPDYVLHTMVRVVRNGEEVKISKRAGSYITLRDLIDWTSKDAVRFFLLSRKPDTEYVFDVDLALAKNNDNPVYYVQYAHARICSILRTCTDNPTSAVHHFNAVSLLDLTHLQSIQALALMSQLAKYPEMLTGAALTFSPHDVTFYLRDLASSYHSYYDAERILVDDMPIQNARVALIAATAQVLRNGLALLGVGAPEKM